MRPPSWCSSTPCAASVDLPAGLGAAFVLAASPATVTLDRGNIPDSVMILLVVLAADSTVTLILTGWWRSAVLVGIWVGLAFQAKMLEAWLLVPGLVVAHLVAGGGRRPSAWDGSPRWSAPWPWCRCRT